MKRHDVDARQPGSPAPAVCLAAGRGLIDAERKICQSAPHDEAANAVDSFGFPLMQEDRSANRLNYRCGIPSGTTVSTICASNAS
jgi:hypothetical protein